MKTCESLEKDLILQTELAKMWEEKCRQAWGEGDVNSNLIREIITLKAEIEKQKKSLKNAHNDLTSALNRRDKLNKVLTDIIPLIQQVANNRKFMQIAGPCRQALNIIKLVKKI